MARSPVFNSQLPHCPFPKHAPFHCKCLNTGTLLSAQGSISYTYWWFPFSSEQLPKAWPQGRDVSVRTEMRSLQHTDLHSRAQHHPNWAQKPRHREKIKNWVKRNRGVFPLSTQILLWPIKKIIIMLIVLAEQCLVKKKRGGTGDGKLHKRGIFVLITVILKHLEECVSCSKSLKSLSWINAWADKGLQDLANSMLISWEAKQFERGNSAGRLLGFGVREP